MIIRINRKGPVERSVKSPAISKRNSLLRNPERSGGNNVTH